MTFMTEEMSFFLSLSFFLLLVVILFLSKWKLCCVAVAVSGKKETGSSAHVFLIFTPECFIITRVRLHMLQEEL